MLLVKIADGQVVKYPYTYDDLKADNPYTSFPIFENLSKPDIEVYGVHIVEPSTQPEFDALNQTLVENNPILIDDKWTQKFDIVEKSEEDKQSIRNLIKKHITDEVQRRLDVFAQSKNYDNILSACSYATSNNARFKVEGQYCIDIRDATWAKLYDILSEVETGTRPIPRKLSDIETELPVLEWPAV